jgi:hypothetical protein
MGFRLRLALLRSSGKSSASRGIPSSALFRVVICACRLLRKIFRVGRAGWRASRPTAGKDSRDRSAFVRVRQSDRRSFNPMAIAARLRRQELFPRSNKLQIRLGAFKLHVHEASPEQYQLMSNIMQCMIDAIRFRSKNGGVLLDLLTVNSVMRTTRLIKFDNHHGAPRNSHI